MKRGLGCGVALAALVGFINPLSAETIDMATEGDQTVSDTSSTSYTNSGDELRTLSLKSNKNYTYSGTVSGNAKVRTYTTTSTRKTLTVSSTTSSHTGGTVVENSTLVFNAESKFGFGTKPITIQVDDTAISGQVRLSKGSVNLTNDLVVVGTVDSGRQTANAAIRDTVGINTKSGVTLSGSIDATGCVGFSIAQNHEYKEATRAMNLTGPVDATGANVYLTIVTNSCLYFKNNLTANLLDCSYYTAACRRGTVSLAAGKSYNIGEFSLACHNATVDGTLSENCILSWVYPGSTGLTRKTDLTAALQLCAYNGSAVETGIPIGVFTLGTDQTINCLTGVVVTAEQAALPGMVLTGSDKTVTLKCAVAQADCYAHIDGALSLVLNAAEKTNCQAFYARTNDMTGTITVQKGVFKIGEGASFPNISTVTVAADGMLDVDSDVEGAVAQGADLYVTSGATVNIKTGVELVFGRTFLDNVQVTKAALLASGVNFTGGGTFRVINEPTEQSDGTWTSAKSGNWSKTANWQGGIVAGGNASTATLAASPVEQDDPVAITLDEDVVLRSVVADGSSYRIAGDKTLAIGSSAEAGDIGVAAADGQIEVAAPVVSEGAYVGVNVLATDSDAAGRVVWTPSSFLAGEFGVPAVYAAAGVTEFPTAASLAVVTAADRLLLGGGTVAYTGAEDATIPGFAIYDTGAGAGIIDVTNENATLTVSGSVVTGDRSSINALSKYGAGRLTLLGDSSIGGTTGEIGGALTLADGSTVPNGFGAAANGTGPTNGIASLNVIGGTLQIGDAEHAPTIETSYGLIIGGRAYRAATGQPGQAGHFVLSNGTVNVTRGVATLGYYGPEKNADGTFPTISYTQHAGAFTVGSDFRIGYSYNTGYQESNQRFTLNGGTFSCADFEVGYSNGPRSDKLKADIVINGGLLRVSGKFTSQDRNNGTRAVFVGNGGRMEVADEVDGYCGSNFKSGSYPTVFTFNEGFVLKTKKFVGRGNKDYPQYKYCEVHFNGGVWEQPLKNATFSDFCDSDVVEAQAGGFNVCLTNDAAKTYSLAIMATVKGEGGMDFYGPGFAKFNEEFTNSMFKGALTIRDGATLLTGADHLQNLNVVVSTNGALRVAEERAAKMESLTLGVTGATVPACIQMMTNASIVVKGDLKVVSPVIFKLAADKLPSSALSGTTLFSGFTIDCATMSAYDRAFLQLDPADVEAGYGLRVRRVPTAGGWRLTASIQQRQATIIYLR